MLQYLLRRFKLQLVPIVHGESDRMAGVRAGLNQGRWYVRLDRWNKSWRLQSAEREAEHKMKGKS